MSAVFAFSTAQYLCRRGGKKQRKKCFEHREGERNRERKRENEKEKEKEKEERERQRAVENAEAKYVLEMFKGSFAK